MPRCLIGHERHVTAWFRVIAQARYGPDVRHFRSILYAVVLAPTVWVLVAVGLTHDLTARGRDGFAVESVTGLVMLLLGGAAYGILVFAPISPLGPTLAGVLFLATGVWAIASPSSYGDAWPHGVVKDGFDLSRPGYGLAALLAVPMILTVLSVRRWRGYQPMVLPLVGQIGRAAAPGTPMAAMQTAVLPIGAPESARTTTLRHLFDGPEERTTLLHRPSAEGESTTVVRRPVDGEATTVLRRVPGEASTADLNPEPATVALPDERPTEDVRDEEPTTALVVGLLAPARPGVDEPTADVTGDEATVDVADEEPTTVFAAQGPAAVVSEDDETVDVAGEQAAADSSAEEPTTVFAVEGPPGEVSGDETTTIVTGKEATTEVADPSEEEPTTVFVAQTPAEEPTTVFVLQKEASTEEPATAAPTDDSPDEPPTAANDANPEPTAEAPGSDEPATEPLVATAVDTSADDQVTSDVVSDEPTAVAPDDASDTGEKPTETIVIDAQSAEEDAADADDPISEAAGTEHQAPPAEEVATEPVPDNTSPEDVGTEVADAPAEDVVAEDAAADEAVAGDAVTGLVADQPTAEPTGAIESLEDEAEPTTDLAADDEEVTTDLVAAGAPALGTASVPVGADGADEEPPGIEEPAPGLLPVMVSAATQPEHDDEDVMGVAEEVEETTYLIVPDGAPEFEARRVFGERTVVVQPNSRVPGETTQMLGTPGEETRIIMRRNMEDTQVIRLPDDGERTQLLNPGRKAKGPDRGASIAGAESPNFADDPTGRLQIPAAQPEEPARTMTVMNMERPPEDAPEIPSPRRSPESDG